MKRSLLSILFLKPGFQFRYISIIFFAILFVCIAMGIHFHWAVVRKLSIDLGYPELRSFLVQANIIMVSLFLSFSVIVLVFAVLVSHKFAGPLHRFEKIIERVADGDFTQHIAIRKDDELFELKDHLNHMIVTIHSKIQTDRKHIQECAQKIIEIFQQLEQPAPDITQVKNTLQNLKDQINTITGGFTI